MIPKTLKVFIKMDDNHLMGKKIKVEYFPQVETIAWSNLIPQPLHNKKC